MDVMGISIMDVVRQSGCNPSSLSLELNGKRPLSSTDALAIAEATGRRVVLSLEIYAGTFIESYRDTHREDVLWDIAEAFGMEVRGGEVRVQQPLDIGDEPDAEIDDDWIPEDDDPGE